MHQVLFPEAQHPVDKYMVRTTHQVNISRSQCLETCVEGLRHAVLVVPSVSMNIFLANSFGNRRTANVNNLRKLGRNEDLLAWYARGFDSFSDVFLSA